MERTSTRASAGPPRHPPVSESQAVLEGDGEPSQVKAQRLSRRHQVAALVGWRAASVPAFNEAQGHAAAIVPQPGVATVVQKVVAWLDVSVQPASGMQKAQRGRQAARQLKQNSGARGNWRESVPA